jgi:hypothetical protein
MPRPSRSPLSGLAVFGAALLGLLLTGCPLDDVCTHDGKTYPPNASFPAGDGCNTCSCTPEGVACTLIACGPRPDAGAASCSHGGKSYPIGASFPSEDGCNSCSCTPSGVACTRRACAPLPAQDAGAVADGRTPSMDTGARGCFVDGKLYPVGPGVPDPKSCNRCECQADGTISGCTEIYCPTCSYGGKRFLPGDDFPSEDGCNTCSCGPDGLVACTKRACAPNTDGGVAGCKYGGRVHAPGDRFPSTDGCNDCFCSEGGAVGCTRKACLPKPDAGTVGCRQGERRYEVGQTWSDGCNTCACTVGGQIACTARACPPETCGVAGSYSYGHVGGLVTRIDRSSLLGGRGYRFERVLVRATQDLAPSCSPPLPGCETAGAITPRQIEAAIAHADVQRALARALTAQPPVLFGRDHRPVDGQVWQFERGRDGASFLVGAPCAEDLLGAGAGCVDPPAGILQLRQLLARLDTQQRATPECKAQITD